MNSHTLLSQPTQLGLSFRSAGEVLAYAAKVSNEPLHIKDLERPGTEPPPESLTDSLRNYRPLRTACRLGLNAGRALLPRASAFGPVKLDGFAVRLLGCA